MDTQKRIEGLQGEAGNLVRTRLTRRLREITNATGSLLSDRLLAERLSFLEETCEGDAFLVEHVYSKFT